MLISSDYLTESVDAVLDNAVYLSESESLNNPKICPVIENSTLGLFLAPFTSVAGVMEAYDLDGDTALAYIAESNNVDPSYLTVCINDFDIIAEPDIVNEFSHYVVNPISENSMAYQLMEACLDGYFNTGNEDYLDYYVEDALFDEETDTSLLNEENFVSSAMRKASYATGQASNQLRKFTKNLRKNSRDLEGKYQTRKAQVQNSLPYKAASAIGGFPLRHKKLAAAAAGIYAYKHRGQIKSAIASKIAALRDKTQQLQQQQQAAATPEQRNIIQRAIDKIKAMIQTLLNKLRGTSNNGANA